MIGQVRLVRKSRGSDESWFEISTNGLGCCVSYPACRPPAQAQYTANFQTNIISGVTSNWSGNYIVGSNTFADVLLIQNGGVLSDGTGYVGYNPGSSSNSVRVVSGGVWENTVLFVGYQGSSNSLVIAGGLVSATNLVVGAASATCDNVVQMNSGIVNITDANGDAVLEVRHGTFILNGGVLQVDRLVMTNACGLFVHHGGILSIGTLVLDPNLDADGDGIPNGYELAHGLDPLNPADASADNDHDGFTNLEEYQSGTDPNDPNSTPFRIAAVVRVGNDIRITWTTASGKTNVVQGTGGSIGGTYTNNFSDLSPIIVPAGNSVTATNYLDIGGATNFPARYYRVRLVP